MQGESSERRSEHVQLQIVVATPLALSVLLLTYHKALASHESHKDTRAFTWSWTRTRAWLPDALLAGLCFGLASGLIYALVVGLPFGLNLGLSAGLIYGLIVGFPVGLPTGLLSGLTLGLLGSVALGFTKKYMAERAAFSPHEGI